ncbi:hypothetical protein CFOL_v3_14879 [Cephalotus follicularis]|uniref:At3g05675-like ankyrin-like domain-containing protein n=1 Tax=Cephalotus follicularis TaxID=3775 RepID=A0A1Q3BTU6_CEPFO|nr:hypothetical protein CFOL_v3_14879 [Cephalotus follicularis]
MTASTSSAENTLKSKEVSTMIKQGFISDQTLSFSSPSRNPTRPPPPPPPPPSTTTATTSRAYYYSPLSSPSKTVLNSPPPAPSTNSTQLTRTHMSDSTQSTRTDSTRSTLFEMMSEEHLRESRTQEENLLKSRTRVEKILAEFNANASCCCGFSFGCGGYCYSGLGSGDVRLTVVGRDGNRVSMDVHKRVLSEKSRFFAEKLRRERGVSHTVEISECDDVEVYVETVVLMYCHDLKRRLMGEDVNKVLGLLKVSAAIMFDVGVVSCLEYLEAVPWSEVEEEKIIFHLSQLQLHDSVTEVLQRVSCVPSTSTIADDIFLKLFTSVLQAKDDKARREMKTVISRLLKEEASDRENMLDVSKDHLYSLCHRCLSSLILCLSEASSVNESRQDRGVLMGEIAREADNLQWIVDILIEKKMGDEFVKLWADQKDLAVLHSKIPTMYSHEISRITAQLCIAIGRGNILVPKGTRYSLLCTWLDALYEDFGWMRRACRSFDKKLVEDGLSQTILTLPLLQQQTILLNWFDRFLNKGDDCPNIQRAFEIWWRRAFIRQYSAEQDNSHLQITVCDYQN